LAGYSEFGVAYSDVAFAQYMPSVQTDHAAYAAGDEVAITGQGFAPHESVTLTATHEDGTAEPGMGHEPWAVTADGAGNVSATWAIDAGDTVGRRFVINAVGAGSGASHSQVGSTLFQSHAARVVRHRGCPVREDAANADLLCEHVEHPHDIAVPRDRRVERLVVEPVVAVR
jgi:hypothetical protein